MPSSSMRRAVAFLFVAVPLLPGIAAACSPCRTTVAAAVFDGRFALTLAMLLLPVALIAALAAWVHHGR